ncbi:Transposable element P transposase, partial [Frankliniella fusca]
MKKLTIIIGRKQSDLKLFKSQELMSSAKNTEDIKVAILHIDLIKPCEGYGFGDYSKQCRGGVKKGVRCQNCKGKKKKERQKQKRKEKTNENSRKQKARERSKKLYRITKQNLRIRNELRTLKAVAQDLRKRCAKLEKSQVSESIKDLPAPQQHAVMACLAAAKRKGPQGNRFLLDWIYECLLMRIKGPKSYEHIRSRKILVLPSRTTLNRYMRKLHPGYGYQPQLFQVLKQKITDFSEGAKHGIIMVDEMKTECGVTFDRHTLKYVGMVDVGTHTPADQKTVIADHVLQVIFKPFQGGWYQTLGCFLTKGAATGPVLSKVLLEGIGLCEGTGLQVDAVVTDGAHWNRNMWDLFGIGEESSSCEHPVDETRKLWFFSDWCHLIKCMRNNLCPIIPIKKKKILNSKKNQQQQIDEEEMDEEGIMDNDEAPSAKQDSRYRLETDKEFAERKKAALNKEVETPDGIVKRSHWIALYNLETNMAKRYGIAALTYVPKLTKQHIFPSGFERMNVRLAYQFFSNNIAAGLNWYRKQGHSELEDSEATEAFVSRVNALADSMNSSDASGAYRKDSKHETNITDFIPYLRECVKLAKRNGKKAFISESTDLGLLVSLRSTVELSTYLIDDIGFDYVMTARFNQDTIE